jgi:ABC-type branched-subunit amino acid transport system ATPase component
VLTPEGSAFARQKQLGWHRMRRASARTAVPRSGTGFVDDHVTSASGSPEHSASADAHALEVRDVSVSYAGVRALDGMSLAIDAGELVGLVGPNGAGKTTFIDAVTGMTPSSGVIELAGSTLHTLSAHLRVRRGMARTFQSLELFEDLTVTENLLASAEPRKWWSLLGDIFAPRVSHSAVDVVARCIDVVGLRAHADEKPSELSLGQRKLVTVARALAASPSVLLLDEPAAGLDSSESLALGHTLRAVAATGVAVLLVDHDMGLVLSSCDRIYVLNFGKVIASGVPSAIAADPLVIEAYLGAESADEVLAKGAL